MVFSDTQYVLMTKNNSYFVEYLLDFLVVSDSISEAMIFNDFFTANRFKEMLLNKCDIYFTISTFIN